MVTRQEPAPVTEEALDIPQCRHHWLIEPANGPISQGVCQNCLETREFQNSIFDLERDY